MNKPTIERLAKLPDWALEYLNTLEQQRDAAIRKLNEWQDSQTESPIYVDDYVCTGEKVGPTGKRLYIQAHKVTFEHCGVILEVTAPFYDETDKAIKLSWTAIGRSCGEVAFIPTSFQNARLVAKENMRQ